MNNHHFFLFLVLITVMTVIVIPTHAAITTNNATVNATCVVMNGTNSGAPESVYFKYGHSTNTGFSSNTDNSTVTGTFRITRCDEPTFMPGYTYKYQACGDISGCGATKTFTMNALVPHATETWSMYGQDFIDHGNDPLYIASHIWDIYSAVWGSFFMLLIIAFVFMNITIKQKSVTMSFLLMLISGGVLFGFAPPELVQIAEILMALALAGLAFWLYKRRR